MRFGGYKQTIPGDEEYSVPQLRRLLRQVGNAIGRTISADEWNEL